ncbi:MAG: DUF2357 domain-containing protein, partial [Clostridiales bacterium]|nr:DUF2357 domain-containing protein [Clostridiales bacterium]
MTDIKRKYIEYAKRIVSVLKDEAFYEQYKQKVAQGASNIRLTKKRLIQDISIDWIDTIEDALPSLDNIVRNPRKFIVQEEDIVDISLARSISTESVKHLAQHTNFIAAVGKDGSVTPSKILNVTKEETFEIYENRFIYTLLLKLKDFVTMRYDKIKKASSAQDVVQLDVEARFNLPAKKVSYRTEYLAQLSFDEVLNLDPATLSKIERVARIDKIISDFLGSPFAKQMRNAALVRPPITRTNVILKNPDFKKALSLWQFVETYEMSAGFSTTDEVQDLSIENEQITQLKEMVALNSLIFETLYDHDVSQDAKIPEGDFIDFDKLEELDKKQPKDEWETDEKIETEEAETKEIDEEVEKQAPPEIEIEERIKTETEEIIKEQEIEKPEPEPEEIEPFDVLDSFLEKSKSRYVKPRNERLRDVDKNRIKAAIARCLEAYYSEKARDEEERSRRIELEKERLALERRRTNQAEIFSDSVRNIVSGFGASVRIVKPKEIKEALVYEAAHPVFRMSTV